MITDSTIFCSSLFISTKDLPPNNYIMSNTIKCKRASFLLLIKVENFIEIIYFFKSRSLSLSIFLLQFSNLLHHVLTGNTIMILIYYIRLSNDNFRTLYKRALAIVLVRLLVRTK